MTVDTEKVGLFNNVYTLYENFAQSGKLQVIIFKKVTHYFTFKYVISNHFKFHS